MLCGCRRPRDWIRKVLLLMFQSNCEPTRRPAAAALESTTSCREPFLRRGKNCRRRRRRYKQTGHVRDNQVSLRNLIVYSVDHILVKDLVIYSFTVYTSCFTR